MIDYQEKRIARSKHQDQDFRDPKNRCHMPMHLIKYLMLFLMLCPSFSPQRYQATNLFLYNLRKLVVLLYVRSLAERLRQSQGLSGFGWRGNLSSHLSSHAHNAGD